jgi:O-antigen ligase
VLAACAVALLACASRGAMVAVLVVGAVAWWFGAVRASGRRPLVRAALLGATLVAAVPLLQSCTSLVEGRLERMGLQNVERLGEVARALTGSPDELLDDDSHRLSLLEESLPLIAARPWFGYGTAGFGVIKERGAHNQFLAVLGENGVVGALLYLAFLAALLRAVARAPEEQRVPCVLLMVAWLLHHFDSHNLLDYRNAILPVAYVCGVSRTAHTAPG